MIEKQEAIQILDEFMIHYEDLMKKNLNNGNEAKSEEMAGMGILCFGLRYHGVLHEDVKDIFDAIQQRKDHYDELIETDKAMGDNDLLHRHKDFRKYLDILEKRFRTIEKNKLRKEGAS